MARGGNRPAMGCDCHFKTIGDASGAIDKDNGAFGRENLARRLFKQLQPAVEMIAFQAKPQMRRHGTPFIAAGFQNDR